ncbi:NAD(P)/FAD-dependent oxidoreductase [Anaerococcus rubeinfantis]|uniref:NAD(P)/FAD-dependent oxidoreductase n=1 Tax=Anaerococcus rubeinfantis TaxID=1720199 RepID=UPI00073F9B96|nr:NAD(P)/FAD-dependent oxidoreductase [Anaerococcus rubeinfantis]
MYYDIIIVGFGPAGISAGLNASIRGKKVLIIGKKSKSLEKSPSIKNYLGFNDIKGSDLYNNFIDHIKNYPVEILDKKIKAVYAMGEYFSVDLGEKMLTSKACIIAAGVDMGKSVEGEDKFFAKGISYCATCDASLYKGKKVVLLGMNDEAIEEANFINKMASQTIFVNPSKKDVKLDDGIEIINKKAEKFTGNLKAESLILEDGQELKADGFFIIKNSSKPESLVPSIEIEDGHIKVNYDMTTNIKGLFACGDITGRPYQINKAVGQGQIAGLNAASFISKNK